MFSYLGSLIQYCCGDRGTLQTNITGMCGECLQCLGHFGFAPTHGMCAFPVYTAQTLVCSAGNCLMLALGCMHSPGLNHSGSGSRVLHKGADSVGPAFCVLQPARLLCPGNFPDKNTGVGCHALFQGIFLTQGWNLGDRAGSLGWNGMAREKQASS